MGYITLRITIDIDISVKALKGTFLMQQLTTEGRERMFSLH